MKDTNFLHTNFPVIPQTSVGPTDASITLKTFAVYAGLAPGWYGVRFTYPMDGTFGSASYQSYSYQCPYTLGIDDFRGAFDPCSGAMPPAGDWINLHQQVAIQAHGCNPTNQWFNGTNCLEVDPTKNCNTFGPRTGDCQTCPDQSYTLSGGRCVIPPTCSADQTLVGVVCVSNLCATSNADGTCASCTSPANEVKSDGSCELKVCTPPLILNINTGTCDVPPSNCPTGFF